jgi:hypothetical protein
MSPENIGTGRDVPNVPPFRLLINAPRNFKRHLVTRSASIEISLSNHNCVLLAGGAVPLNSD